MKAMMKLSTGVFKIDSPTCAALPCGSGAGERENSRADDRADAEAGEIEGGERALHLAIGRLRFAN